MFEICVRSCRYPSFLILDAGVATRFRGDWTTGRSPVRKGLRQRLDVWPEAVVEVESARSRVVTEDANAQLRRALGRRVPLAVSEQGTRVAAPTILMPYQQLGD